MDTFIDPIPPRIFNYKKALQNLNINDPKAKPPSCFYFMTPHSPRQTLDEQAERHQSQRQNSSRCGP